MHLPLRFVTAVIALSLFTAPALAQEDVRKDYFTFYSGSFDVLDHDNRGQFGVEYRANPLKYNIVPVMGFNIDTKHDVYGYGGLNWDLFIADGLVLTPNFMVGAYGHGDGKRLGGVLEFRSGIEMSFMFKDMSRAGVAFNHISNAGIYDHNPGAETLLFNYSLPLKKFF